MSQQTYQPPVPPHGPMQPQPRNGLGITGFVLGVTGLVFSPIPVVGMIAWPLVILGLIFSIVGVVRVKSGKATNKWLSIIGIIASVVGLVVCIVWVAVIGSAVNEVNQEVNRVAKVKYEVTGEAKNVDVSYGEALSPKEETVATLPWSKETENKGAIKGGLLTVTVGEEGGTVTCKITVDGEVVSTKTDSGAFLLVVRDRRAGHPGRAAGEVGDVRRQLADGELGAPRRREPGRFAAQDLLVQLPQFRAGLDAERVGLPARGRRLL